jgi:hypothetical protein
MPILYLGRKWHGFTRCDNCFKGTCVSLFDSRFININQRLLSSYGPLSKAFYRKHFSSKCFAFHRPCRWRLLTMVAITRGVASTIAVNFEYRLRFITGVQRDSTALSQHILTQARGVNNLLKTTGITGQRGVSLQCGGPAQRRWRHLNPIKLRMSGRTLLLISIA